MVVLFDGVCNLCNAWVNFVIDRDPSGRFYFAAQQSPAGQSMIRAHGLSGSPLCAIVLVAGDRVYIGSTAILHIFAGLRNLWPVLKILILVPTPIRDAIYGWVARHRYRWFGKSDACRVPTPELKQRFVE